MSFVVANENLGYNANLLKIGTDTKIDKGQEERKIPSKKPIKPTKASHHFFKLCPNFNVEACEPYTNRKWHSLFKTAVENNVPYYVIAVVTSLNKEQGNEFSIAYDAVNFKNELDLSLLSFTKHLQEKKYDKKDPLTEQPIVKVDLFALSCFQLIRGEQQNCELDLTKVNHFWSNPLIKNKIFDDEEEGEAYLDLALEGCNYFVGESRETDSLKQLAQIQGLIGKVLVDTFTKESKKWLHSFSVNMTSVAKSSDSSIYYINSNINSVENNR